jgi:hypothetical protein
LDAITTTATTTEANMLSFFVESILLSFRGRAADSAEGKRSRGPYIGEKLDERESPKTEKVKEGREEDISALGYPGPTAQRIK